jgi:hypothetical protein
MEVKFGFPMSERSASEEQAMREAHLDKLVSLAALRRIDSLVQGWEDEHNAKHRIIKKCLVAAGTLFVLVAVAGLLNPGLFTAAALR